MPHICDNRCFGENGHHSWPSPGKDECLCAQRFQLGVEKVWCPLHDGQKKVVVEEPLEVRLAKIFTIDERKRLLEALEKIQGD